MIKVENVEVWGFEHAVRGVRNPLASWNKSDSGWEQANFCDSVFMIGDNDLDLMRRLYQASLTGNFAHRKFLRQIFVSMDITAPLYWWKEMDQYKVGTTTNSCSTMHTIHRTGIDESLFSFDGGKSLTEDEKRVTNQFLQMLEKWRTDCKSGDETWRNLIQWLPEGFNQKRTITMNYENVVTMIMQRAGHKLSEWNEFVEIIKTLPYIKEITEDKEKIK